MKCSLCASIWAFSSNDCRTHPAKSLQIVISFIVFNWFISCYSTESVAFHFVHFVSWSHSLGCHSIAFILGNFSHPNFVFVCVQSKTFDCSIAWSEHFFVRCYFSYSFIHLVNFTMKKDVLQSNKTTTKTTTKKLYILWYAMRAWHCTRCLRWASYKTNDNWKSSK